LDQLGIEGGVEGELEYVLATTVEAGDIDCGGGRRG